GALRTDPPPKSLRDFGSPSRGEREEDLGDAGFASGFFASLLTACLIDCIAEEISTAPEGGAAVLASSSSPNSTAIGWFTFTPSLPSGTRILTMRPSSTA